MTLTHVLIDQKNQLWKSLLVVSEKNSHSYHNAASTARQAVVIYVESLAMAGLGRGWPGRTAGGWWGSLERCNDWLWSCSGWMIEVFLAGTVSGVGCASPVVCDMTGIAAVRPGIRGVCGGVNSSQIF